MIELPTDANPAVVVNGECAGIIGRLSEESVDLIIADPPFGSRRPSARRLAGERFDEIEGNAEVNASWIAPAVSALKDGGCAYIFTCWDKMEEWRLAMMDAGLRVRSCIVWDKMVHGMADLETCWAPQHEFILFGSKGRHELRGKRPKDIIRVQRMNSTDLVHPYQKPADLMLPLIEASSSEGDVILDPFCGSGTVGIAAVRRGRRYIGIEISEEYSVIAKNRISDAIGVGSLFPPTPAKEATLFEEPE